MTDKKNISIGYDVAFDGEDKSVVTVIKPHNYTLDELRGNFEKFIEVHGKTRLVPWQMEILERLKKPLKIERPEIRMRRDSGKFESRIYASLLYGQKMVAEPRGYLIKNVTMDESNYIFPINHKQTIPRRNFKRWVRRKLK